MLLESGALQGSGSGVDDGVRGGELRVQGAVVADGVTEMEDGRLVGVDAVCVGVVVVVIRGVGVFDVGRGISGRAHVCEKGGKMWIKTEEKGSNTEISRRVSYYIPLPTQLSPLFPPFSLVSLCHSPPSQLKVLPGIRRITQWVVNGRHLIRSFPFETETKGSPITTKPPRFDCRQCHTTSLPRISLCRQQPRYQLVHHLHRVLRYQ